MPTIVGPHAVENIMSRFCPADTCLKLWDCPVDYQMVENVMSSAITGFKIWKKLSQAERNNFLLKYKEEVTKKQEQIAMAIAYETGKPLWEAKTEVASVIENISMYDRRLASSYSK